MGYFVPESAWNEFEEASAALAAIGDLANQAQGGVVTNSERLKSLIDLFQSKLQMVRAAGEFLVLPQEGAR